MLDGLAAKAHFCRVSIEPRLHGLKDGFVLGNVRFCANSGLMQLPATVVAYPAVQLRPATARSHRRGKQGGKTCGYCRPALR